MEAALLIRKSHSPPSIKSSCLPSHHDPFSVLRDTPSIIGSLQFFWLKMLYSAQLQACWQLLFWLWDCSQLRPESKHRACRFMSKACPLQGSGEVLSVNVTLLGRPGLVRMHVRDAAGHAGGSALTPDTLELKLAAGPMTGLAFEGAPALACGMRSVLGALRVIAVDDFGNQTTSPAFEVCIRSCLRFGQ